MIATTLRSLLLVAFAAVASPVDAQEAPQAAKLATVFLVDGQSFTAAIDARSDENRLVLRFESETATLLRRIRWNRVEKLRIEGEQLSGEQVRAELSKFVSVAQRGIDRDLATGQAAAVDAEMTQAEQAQRILGATAQVRSLAVDAVPANFNADVPVDGLVVVVAPLDGWGRFVAARGTVEIELFGDRRSHLKPQPLTRREQFDRLGRWVVTLDEQHLTADGYVFQLPYEAFDPAETLTIDPSALVNVRLSVPGQGVYEASAADIRLLPFSPLRNRIECATGSRYLPAEATGF